MKLLSTFCMPIVFILSVLSFTKVSYSAKILSVAFVSSPSHKITYQDLLNELGARGHEVTVVSPIVAKKKFKNVKEILTFDAASKEDEMPNMFELKENDDFIDPRFVIHLWGDMCAKAISLPHIQALRKEKFDLIVMPAIFNECTSGWIYHFNASLILVSPTSLPQWTTSQLGIPNPPSFVPNFMSSYGDNMTFYERTMNVVSNIILEFVYNWMFVPHMEAIYRDKLNDSTIPSSHEILRNASLVLTNSHISLNSPRPSMPISVEVGGMHCRKAQSLPKDLEIFVNSSRDDGFILFSMGSALKGSRMPENKRKIILGAFSKLKQKVLWKWETETMEDLPPNVKLSKWLPQQDVLGHPKIKAFITHGGFGSTTEAVYHGVPLVGIPMFGDQDLNMQRSEANGFAVTLQYNDFTEQDLLDALHKVIYEPSYKENVMRLSTLFRDQPKKALDTAVFWVEYVLRHKGAYHLRSAARELNFFQYHSLDVIGSIFALMAAIFYIILAFLKFLFRKLFVFSKHVTNNKKKIN